MKNFPSIIILSLYTFTYAADLQHSLTNQGFTGLINTPNAMVMKEGDITFHYNNQLDNSLTGYNYDKSREPQDDYIFGVGLFPYMELQGRLSEAPGYHRDLSANIKLQFPYKHQYLPNFAIGAQDIGSAANQYGNIYAVMDKEFYFIRASLGYGHSTVDSKAKRRMDGLFGGLEIKTFDWLYLVAEDDSTEQFAALRLHMPKEWSSSFQLTTLISTNITNEYETSFNINLTFPLYENIKSYSEHSINSYTQEVKKTITQEKNSTILPKVSIIEEKQEKNIQETLSLEEIKNKLIDLGIENISIGIKNETIYLSYENGTFLFNDLDAMGVAIGLLTHTKYKKFILEQKRSKTRVFTLSGNLEKAKKFYSNPNIITKNTFINSLEKISKIHLSKFILAIENKNSSTLKPKLELAPVVKTFIGNEFGLFNYMLWLEGKLQVNLYKGIDITAVGKVHINDSEIDDHRYDWFMKLYEEGSSIDSIMIHTNNSLFGGVNTLSFGTFQKDFIGAVDQYIYNIYNHTFNIKAGYFTQFQDGDPYKEKYLGKVENRNLLLAKYSYLIKDYDTLLEINGGQYWNQDKGFELQVKRFFGDVAVSILYQETTPYIQGNVLSEETNRYAGLGIEIPLTLKHTPNLKYGQIRGTNSFNYTVRSTIAREDGSNTIVPGGNYNPKVAIDSQNYFYNRNRLQLSYFKTHAFRLVESYENYAE